MNPSPEFIAAIYEAALRPDGLPILAHLLRQTMDVRSVGVWLAENGLVGEISLIDDVPELQKPYPGHDPMSVVWSLKPGTPVDMAIPGPDHVIAPDRESSAFDTGLARNCDVTDSIGGMTAIDPQSPLPVGADRQSKAFTHEAADRDVLNAAIPHIKAAMQLRQRSRFVERPFPGSALDALSFATIICNTAGRPIHLNAAADAMLGGRQTLVLRAMERTLSAAFAADSQGLSRLIFDAANDGKTGSMILRDRRGERAAMLLVTPVPTGTLQHPGPDHAMLAVRPLLSQPSFDAARLTQLFRLSPAQAALALALYEGKSFEDIATERCVKISTLRTHFGEVLNRTGAKGLRDLIRLLGEIPPLR